MRCRYRYAAYDVLSDTMKGVLDPLEALHTAEVHINRYEQVGGGPRREKHPEATHASSPRAQHPGPLQGTK